MSSGSVLTVYQAQMLLMADHIPRSAQSLTGDGKSERTRKARVEQLVRAGFLQLHMSGRVSRYAITPAGRELAELLRRLEAAREA